MEKQGKSHIGGKYENIFNRQIKRADTKMGNWVEERAYWDAC